MTKASTDMKRSMTKRVLTRKLWVLLIAALLVVGPLPWPVTLAQGARFTVTKTNDTNDGRCDSDCSLREAIVAANAMGGPKTIVLQAGQTYTLSLDELAPPEDLEDEDSPADDDLDVTSEITIQGNRATVERSTGMGFECNLDGAPDRNEFRIFTVQPGGNLTLQDVTIRNGRADGSFLVDGFGGGIYVGIGAPLTVINSTITSNSADGAGGGIANDGRLTITNSTITSNSTDGDGGGLFTGGEVEITASTISNNRANRTGGGLSTDASTVKVTTSTISGNEVTDAGGGLFAGDSQVNITNSMISDNRADDDGGGIFNFAGTVNASFVTIANNSASSGQGGGIFNDSGATFTIKNSIVGNNTAGGGSNCSNSGTLTASGTNLTTDGSCPGFTRKSTEQLNLGGLELNAPGTTQTHALLSGSAAIDAVTDCTDLQGHHVTTDQRGISRPHGSRCDVGAYERALPGAANVVRLDGSGHCLELELSNRSYRLIRADGRSFTGQLSVRQHEQVVMFENVVGEGRLLGGTVNLASHRGSAMMVFSLGQGGGLALILDLESGAIRAVAEMEELLMTQRRHGRDDETGSALAGGLGFLSQRARRRRALPGIFEGIAHERSLTTKDENRAAEEHRRPQQ